MSALRSSSAILTIQFRKIRYNLADELRDGGGDKRAIVFGGQWGIADHKEVKARERNQVHGELAL